MLVIYTLLLELVCFWLLLLDYVPVRLLQDNSARLTATSAAPSRVGIPPEYAVSDCVVALSAFPRDAP